MNPLDLPGPQFLVFYVILGGILAAFLWIYRHHGEKADPISAPELTDPYLVAVLRAGPKEIWRLATVRLVDRGLMRADGATISVVAGVKAEHLENDVERATLEWFREPKEAVSLVKESLSSRHLQRFVQPYETRLIELGLLLSADVKKRNQTRYVVAVSIFALVAIFKILLALDRGHKNVAILLVLAVVGPIALHQVGISNHTLRGRAVLKDLEKLFSRLHRPGAFKAGQSSAEVMWMAAVFGLPALTFAHVEQMYPTRKSDSCGSSCGSSCGGGGCGGGCGGCGG